MDPSEKQHMLAELEQGRRELLEALRGVTEEAAAQSPGPGRWSARDCVEHVAVVEEYLLGAMESSHAAESPSDDRRRERAIAARGADRRFHVEAPEVARPTGRFPSLELAAQHFLAARERTVLFVEQCGEDLRARLTLHPVLGQVNCQETLVLMAVHPRRHAAQIREALLSIEANRQGAQAETA